MSEHFDNSGPGRYTVSASRISAAIGLNDTLSRFRLYREIVHGERQEVDEWTRQVMAFGTEHESHAVAYAEAASGFLFGHTGDHQERLRKGRYTGTPDGRNDDCVLEVKSRAPGYAAYDVGDKHWAKYLPQMQQQMWLADVDKAIFACWCVGGGSRCWLIHRSEKYLDKLHELSGDFLRFCDGDDCPKRCSKPTMPAVKWDLLDGPPCTVQQDLSGNIAAAIKQTESLKNAEPQKPETES